jgi:branched-chain amino acid transport system ATP-binding protein
MRLMAFRRSAAIVSADSGPEGSGLSISNMNAWYGQGQVLFDVGMVAEVGEMVGIFGHNGAGKSTLFRAIAGVHRQSSFTGWIGGSPLHHQSAHRIARSGLVLVREGARVFEGLTVQEHLLLGRRLAGIRAVEPVDFERIHAIFPILSEFRRRPAAQLSGGQRQLLALGTAFASNPLCLLLDEPSTGLAPAALETLHDALVALAANGLALVVAEQNPEWLGKLATRAYLLSTGVMAPYDLGLSHEPSGSQTTTADRRPL